MKTTITMSFIILLNLTTMAQSDGNFKLPETWDKDFYITNSHSGSRGGDSKVRITYDSLTYTHSSTKTRKLETKTYPMTEADRVNLLGKLKKLNVEKIKSEQNSEVAKDGWQHSICFGLHCIEGGTSAILTEEDKNNFLEASRAIYELARSKEK